MVLALYGQGEPRCARDEAMEAKRMKVALLGAPGAGKTDIAKRLARALNRDNDGHKWITIDGYVDRLAQRTGRVYGEHAGFPHNIQVMAERWTLEAEASNKGLNTITCGTIYETIIYAARIVAGWTPSTENELMSQGMYADVCMRFLGAMEDTTFNYDVMFYLPWTQERVDSADRDWNMVVNSKIPEVLDAEFKAAITLTGTPRQKVTNALEKIRFIRTFDSSSSSEDDGPSV